MLAARKYHELSKIPEIDVSERLEALSAAVICAGIAFARCTSQLVTVLAPAGPERTQVLSTLYADSRSTPDDAETEGGSISPILSTILQNMYSSRLLGYFLLPYRSLCSPDHIHSFTAMLRPHQLATLGDGFTTVVARAVMEHNLVYLRMIALLPNQLSATRLYANISFSELGQLLGCSEDAAELAASRMISEGRMKGKPFEPNFCIFQEALTSSTDLCSFMTRA